jgi:hypothetical protein
LALVCAFAVAGLIAPAASGFVYWGNRESGNIGRANLDGSASNPALIRLPPSDGASPCGLAVDATHIYWADINNDKIGRANLDGTGVDANFIDSSGTGDEPCGLAIDGTYLYWSNKFSPGGVGRALLNGTGAQQLVAATDGACGVAVDGAHVYWGDLRTPASVGRADLDGSNPDPGFLLLDDLVNCGISVDASHIYVAEQGPFGSIARADLDGGNFNDNFAQGDNPCGVAVNATSIFWPEEIDETVAHANLDGSGIDLGFIGGADFPCGVALDSLSIPECKGQSALTGHDQALRLAIDCTGTSPLTFSIVSPPHNGHIDSFDSSAGTFTYVPSPGFAGVDTFSYEATNAYGKSAIATATVAVAPAPTPSNSFSVAGLRRHKRKGTATLLVSVPGAGRVSVSGTGLRAASDETIDAGLVSVPLRARGRALARLRSHLSAKVRLAVTFAPTGGAPSSTTTTVKLVRRA